jgi:nucleotide-binding universal stress UspA family protein
MTPSPRVVVGVTGSLTNLCALREAVTTARDRRAVLHAVHVWENGHDLETVLATAHKPGVVSRVRLLERAFGEAMGGLPPDVDVRRVVVEGAPEVRLVRLADRSTDLLVVGASAGRGWWRRFSRSVPSHCVRRARCPVLVVPPTEMVRGFGVGRDRPSGVQGAG